MFIENNMFDFDSYVTLKHIIATYHFTNLLFGTGIQEVVQNQSIGDLKYVLIAYLLILIEIWDNNLSY